MQARRKRFALYLLTAVVLSVQLLAIASASQGTARSALTLDNFPDIRVKPDTNGDFSWGLPAALLLGDRQDQALYVAKLEQYATGVPQSELLPPRQLRSTLAQVLLDSVENRKLHYTSHGVPFGDRQEARVARVLDGMYRNLTLQQREYLASALGDLYTSLYDGKASVYRQQLQELKRHLIVQQIMRPETPATPLKVMQDQLDTATRQGLGNYLNLQIHAPDLQCRKLKPWEGPSPDKRVVIDPGHFGGAGVKDSREYHGYREGRATLIVALLLKAYLTQCWGFNGEQVLLTRYDLYSMPGNDRVGFRNNALMDYRSEWLALLKPDLALALHTDGGPQRISLYIPSTEPLYYLYRGRGFHGASATTAAQSRELANALLSSLESALHPLQHRPPFAALYTPQPSLIRQGRSKVFQNLLQEGIPMVLIEGISHASEGMPEFLDSPTEQAEEIHIADQRYNYNPLLRFYAEGVAHGLRNFFVTKQ